MKVYLRDGVLVIRIPVRTIIEHIPEVERPLTRTETRVRDLMALGRTDKEIAATMRCTTRTVKFHAANVFKKLGVKRIDLVRSSSEES